MASDSAMASIVMAGIASAVSVGMTKDADKRPATMTTDKRLRNNDRMSNTVILPVEAVAKVWDKQGEKSIVIRTVPLTR